MNRRPGHKGFSLTEVLLAAGILVIGFMMIAGTLPVGIKLTAMGTERTIAAVVADEAFAKVRLFGISDPNLWSVNPNFYCVDYAGVSQLNPNSDEYSYPSTDVRPDVKKYHWAAMLKYNMADWGLDTFQVTVFVSRDTGLNTRYPYPSWDPLNLNTDPLLLARYPRPVRIPVDTMGVSTGMVDTIQVAGATLSESQDLAQLITDESVLLDDRTGQIMRVLERGINDPISGIYDPTMIRLDAELFDAAFGPRDVWVIPPAQGSGRYPCVGVYQRTIKFRFSSNKVG